MRFFFLPLLLAGFCAFAQDNPITVSSEIKAVTVFRQAAQITREAQTSVPQGNHTLLFSQLPQSMDPNSIQLEGSGDLTILSITHKRNYLTEDDKSSSMLDLEKQLEVVEKKINSLQAELEALAQEKKMILANQKIGTENYSLQQLQQTAEFFRTRIQSITEKEYDLNRQVQELEKKRRKIQSQLQQERQSFSVKTGQVEVKVLASSSTTARFELSYLVHNASWSSSYDARVDDLQSPVKLTQKAIINQQTGEDWKNVKLSLNTGNPIQGQQVPYLSTWYVDYIQNIQTGGAPAQYGDAVQKQMLRNADVVSMDDAESLEEQEISYQNFEVSQNLIREEYTIDRPQSIASSGNPEVVHLRVLELPAVYQYHIKPRLQESAFLIAKVYDWEQYNLMNGQLSLYNGNAYVGNAYLNTQTPDDTLQLSLGRDENIVVSRKRIRSKTEKSFLGRNRIEDFTWKIEIRNTKKTPVSILLKEPVPVSRNEEIEVEVEEISGGKLDKETGILKWEFSLEPNRQREFSVTYSIKYPRGRQVNF